MVRSKGSVNASVKWGPWNIMVPSTDPEHHDRVPTPDVPPSPCEPHEWPELQSTIVPKLRKFYGHAFKHPVTIPLSEQKEMLKFLEDGPSPPVPPSWIDFKLTGALQTVEETADPVSGPVSAPVPDRPRVWRPFLHPEGAEGLV